jgi:uncharacterized protein
MKFRVDHIKDTPYPIHVDEPVDIFPVLSGLRADGICDFCGPVNADISVRREYDHLRASGRVQVPIELSCSRCLVRYRADIDSSFRIIFVRESSRHRDTEEELELSDDDLVSVLYSGDEIDLTHEIEEQVAMDVPMKPLCSDGCKGLCPTCGADLNLETCGCSDVRGNLAFRALKDFKVSS